MPVKPSRKLFSASSHRGAVALLLSLALVAVQMMGLHFHVDQSAQSLESSAATTVHAEHSGTHSTHHEPAGEIDLSTAEFWKNPDQGWKVFALLGVVCVLLLFIRGRGVPALAFTDRLPYSHPVFLRPPLRAPPL